MRIAIDGRAVGWTGIGRYVRNLVRCLKEIDSDDEYVLLAGKKDLSALRGEAAFDSPRVSFYPVDGSYYSWREQTILPAQLARVRADLFHFTHFNAPIFFPRPYVVTIHDATRFFFLGQTKRSLYSQVAYEYVFTRAVKRARAVICVSESTRVDLESLSARESGGLVIHEGIEKMFWQSPTEKEMAMVRRWLGFAGPYFLYVGVWMDHKNVRRIVEAFARARKENDWRLVMTGSPRPGYVDLPAVARRYGVEDRVVFPGFVPHELLPALYSQAEVFLFPSLYEGFGLPALEAAASGTAVISSNVSSLPEIMGQAAWYVNPEDVVGLAEAMEKLGGDKSLRRGLIKEGRSRAGEFSWDKAAREHWLLYKSVLK